MSTAELEVRITGSSASLSAALNKSTSEVRGWERSLQSASQTASRGLKIAALGFAGVAAWGLKVAAGNQSAAVSFELLLGSAEKAGSFMKELQAFAAKTPFEFPQLREAASKLLAVGVAAKDVIPIMETLGDATAAMGTGAEGIDRATRALTQMEQKGKVTAEEMLQLTEAGIPAWDALAAKLGVDVATAMEMVTDRTVDAGTMFEALEDKSGSALQRMTGMMDEQSKTLEGLLSTLKDTVGQGLATVMEPVVASLTEAMPEITSQLEKLMDTAGPELSAAMEDAVGAFIDILPELVNALPSLVQGFASLLGAIRPLVPVFASLLDAAGPLLPVIVPLMAALATAGKVSKVVRPIANLASSLDALRTGAAGAARTVPGATQGVLDLGGAAATGTTKMSKLAGAIGSVGAVAGAAAAGWEIGTAIYEGVVKPAQEAAWAAEDLKLAWDANLDVFDAVAQRSEPVAKNLDLIKNTFANLRPELEANQGAMERVFTAESTTAIRQAAEAGAQVNTVIRAIAGGMSAAAAQAAISSGAFDTIATSMHSVATEAGNSATAIQTADGKTRLFIETAKGVEEITFDPTKTSAIELAKAIGVPVAEAEKLLGLVSDLPEYKKFTYEIEMKYSTSGGTGGLSGMAPPGEDIIGLTQGLAKGGPVKAGSPYIVGERGPEFFVPKTDGEIVPNHKLSTVGAAAPMAGGGSTIGPVYITIEGSGDAREVAIRVRDELISLGRRSGRVIEAA